MKSIRTDPLNHAAEGDERIRTAVPAPSTDPAYEPPPGWKKCPHCLGSGLVQADDRRETTSPLDRAEADRG